MTDWRIVPAALFAPLVVWILWRLQSLSVDKVLRRGMHKLLRYQRTTYNIVSWFGVLLHELSHAFFLLLGGHGIRKFKVGVDAGHVVPHQARRGPLGLITFVIAALAPMFVAPALILAVTWWLLDPALVAVAAAGPGWDAAWPVLRDMATRFPERLALALVGLDVTTWQGGLVFALIVLALPSARPSFVPGRGQQRDEGDIAVVRAKLRRHPVTFAAAAGVLIATYALVWWSPRAYWAIWQAVWATSMVAILLSLGAGLGWRGVAVAGRIRWFAAWIPWAFALAVQVAARVGPWGMDLWLANLLSLGGFVGLAYGLSAVAGRRW